MGSSLSNRSLLARFTLERFDAIMLAAVGVFVGAIFVVILRGDQTGGGAQPASGLRVVYLGPVASPVQNLYAVKPIGGTPSQITDTPNGIMDFDVFPNGRVVFAEQRTNDDGQIDGSTNVKLYDPDTGQTRLLFACADATCNEVAASPDGNQIAFDRSDLNIGTNLAPGAPRIWLFDMQQNRAFPLFSDNQKIGYGARWSPDGKLIALWDSDRGGIVLYNFVTKEESVVPAYGGRNGTFSPDSQRIWFPRILNVGTADAPQYVTHISVADISKQPYRIHDLISDRAADDDVDPIWSPDGNALYVLRRPAGATLDQDRQIFQLDIATGKATPILVDYAYTHSNLHLSPRGDQLLFQRFRMGAAGARPEVWVYDIATKQARQLVSDGNLPQWLP
jgi:dipeptidyl aminopeptidase/acylaminoacyl peptidase